MNIPSIIESSFVGRGSNLETPNTNLMPTPNTQTVNQNTHMQVVDKLTSQVQELESKLESMQRQQSLREMTAEAAKQSNQAYQQQQAQPPNQYYERQEVHH